MVCANCNQAVQVQMIVPSPVGVQVINEPCGHPFITEDVTATSRQVLGLLMADAQAAVDHPDTPHITPT